MSDQTKPDDTAGRPRRWWQFGLRGLMFLVLLVAVGLLACREYLQPYWRQQQTVWLVERLGGSCQTAEADHWWLRLAAFTHNVTQVNLADCDDPDAYVADVAELPAIELLIVGGPALTDEHARRLYRMRSLRGLILDSTSVSDEGLAALREALSGAEVYVSQRRAIAALRKFGNVIVLPIPSTSPRSPLQQLVGDEWFEEAQSVDIRGVFRDFDAVSLKMLSQLGWLHIRDGIHLTDEAISNLSGLRQLGSISIERSKIGDAGLRHLRELSQLRHLSISGAWITDAGLEHLKGLSQLQELELLDSRVTAAGVADLSRALPNCEITLSRKTNPPPAPLITLLYCVERYVTPK